MSLSHFVCLFLLNVPFVLLMYSKDKFLRIEIVLLIVYKVIHEINRYCSSGGMVKVFIALTNLSFSDSLNGAVG